jgi:4-amino-4-deoxy-L-arabinose transferase-like glycosyltransferase
MKNPLPTAAWLILLLALLLRVGYIVATPGYELVHDARDYDRAAVSIASGDGWPYSRAPGRETAFRPPAYPVLLAGVYKVTGVEHGTRHQRVVPARILGIIIGTLIVAMIFIVARQLWGRRVALLAMLGGAIYVPLILVGA